ncbi:hypothetical protein HMPREF0653_02257 [Prevotella disiens JCM 6334 = ATCC 29426]|nr:hypothetical protein HMPREF0653_02257 [Prevotella disiens JCM 6334 = ATCC 29426]
MEGDYNSRLNKMQKEEYLIKNACYSVTKYYLCKRNNKRSLLGRKQRSQVARSFPNRYLFSCINKVTSLFSDRYIFIIILACKTIAFATLFLFFILPLLFILRTFYACFVAQISHRWAQKFHY